MTTIIPITPEPFGDPAFGIPATYPRVRFKTRCPAREVYLLIGEEDGTSVAFHRMDEGDADLWHVEVRLKARRYRCRSFAKGESDK